MCHVPAVYVYTVMHYLAGNGVGKRKICPLYFFPLSLFKSIDEILLVKRGWARPDLACDLAPCHKCNWKQWFGLTVLDTDAASHFNAVFLFPVFKGRM